ncbi:hypothetical protein ACPA9J_24425 [Pseudomonas aeruginosa]
MVDDAVRQLIDDMYRNRASSRHRGLPSPATPGERAQAYRGSWTPAKTSPEPRVFINPEFEPLIEDMDQCSERCPARPGFCRESWT